MASLTEWNRLPQSVQSQNTITEFRSQLKNPVVWTCILFIIAHYLAVANLGFRHDMSLDFPFSASSALEDITSIWRYIKISILCYSIVG